MPRFPDDFAFKLLGARLGEVCRAAPQWPVAASRPGRRQVAKFVNGPESFTPDNNFIMGETPELKNLFVAAGFNSAGIACAGGAGKYLAEWMIEGQADAGPVERRCAAVRAPFQQPRASSASG